MFPRECRRIYKLKIALLLMLFCSSIVSAKDYSLSFSICKVNSSCSECIERVSAEISINESNHTVLITGKSASGASVTDRLPNCNIESELNWKCEGLRGVIVAENGVVKYTPSNKKMKVGNMHLELCSNN